MDFRNFHAQVRHQSRTSRSASGGVSRWQLLGKLATAALLAEARLTPKPALVDERGSGAHSDLTLNSMLQSSLVLEPFFQEMAHLAAGVQPNTSLRQQLAECGRRAEIAMYRSTGGSNAHRGAIWCLGLLVASSAIHKPSASTAEIAATAGELAQLPDENAPKVETHGQVVKRTYAVDGAGAEAQSGFPHVIEVGLPHLRCRRLAGAPETSCRLDALLAIMSTLDDTCLLYRGGPQALETAKIGAREVIALDGTENLGGMVRLYQLDRDLVRLNASPRGSADLLSATLFLDSVDFANKNSDQIGLDKYLNNIGLSEKLNGNARI